MTAIITIECKKPLLLFNVNLFFFIVSICPQRIWLSITKLHAMFVQHVFDGTTLDPGVEISAADNAKRTQGLFIIPSYRAIY